MFKKYLLFILISINLFALEKVSLQLAWLDQYQFAGYYMAKEKGFYKEVGLDVELKKYNYDYSKNRDIINDVLSGSANYGISHSNLVVDKSNNKQVIALASIFQSSPLVLISLKSSNITTLSDLKDKTISLTKSNLGTTALRAMLASQGFDTNKNIIKEYTFSIDELINKESDLINVYISNELYSLNKKNIDYNIFAPKDEGYDFYSDILFTSNNEYNNNPKRVEKFRAASLKGWKYAFDNIHETVDIIFNKYNTQNKTKEALFFEAKQLKKLAYYKTSELGDINIKKMQRIFDIYKIMGEVKGKIDLNSFIYSNLKLNLSMAEKKFISNIKKLKVHNENKWPPYNYNEFGLPKGYSIDYMNILAKRLGIEIEYISNKSWNEFLTMIKNKDLDLMLNIVNTPDRRKYINFTKSYAESLPTIYVLGNRTDITSLKDLDGKTVSVPKGFYTSEIIKKHYPNIKLKLTKNMLEALKDVAFRRADATISDFAVASYLIKNHGIVNIKGIVDTSDQRFVSHLNIGVRNDMPILRSIIEKGMKNIKDEDLIKLRHKWFGNDLTLMNKKILFTKKEKIYLHKKSSIDICIDPSWAPYEYLHDGEHLGITSDYTKYFSDILNMPFNLVITDSFYESLSFIKDKKCDLIPAAAITINRLNYINFTKPYLSSPFALATLKSHKKVDYIKNILDKEFGMVKGYASIDIFLKKYPRIKIKEFDTISDGLKAVNKGEIYGFIDIPTTLSSAITKDYFTNIKIARELEERLELSVALRNDSNDLLSIFQKLVTSISKKEKDRILNKWITVKYEHKFDYSLIGKVFLPIVLFLGIIIFYLWTIKLKREIKNRKELEKELKNSLENFKILVDSTIEAIFLIEKSGRCIEANHEARKLFKFSKNSDYIGKHIYFIIANDDKEKVRKEIRKNKSFPREIRLIKKDGTIFPGLVKGENVRKSNQTMRIVSIVDLTELKEKEHLLFQQSKLASMGEMMSAIAHQWRQPLNALAALNMKVETKLEFQDTMDLEEYKPICEGINNQLNYMSKTIDDFRDFFIPSKKKIHFNICDVIENVFSMLKPQLENYNIEYTFSCKDAFIDGYPNEFKQVIINILNNAKDAIVMNKIPNGKIDINIMKGKKKFIIFIKDNGGGISDEVISKIFNPYFTTKFESKGTGIGLYMSKMIIEKSMNGELKVESKKNETIFSITIS